MFFDVICILLIFRNLISQLVISINQFLIRYYYLFWLIKDKEKIVKIYHRLIDQVSHCVIVL